MLECVANVSEGRDARVIESLALACRSSLLDVHSDPDHHRSVFTIAGPGSHDAETAVRLLARAVARHVSIADHVGVHPRLGALDVVPFVELSDAHDPDRPGGLVRPESSGLPDTPGHMVSAESAQGPGDPDRPGDAAIAFARWWSESFAVPVFLYGESHPGSATLPEVRRTAFRSRRPDFGPAAPHPTLGATAVGARPPLVALNCELVSPSTDVAKRIASAVRERDGGLRGVRALGLLLASVGRSQVSMNLADLESTGVEAAVSMVRELARHEGTEVATVELVGLLPRSELNRCSADFLAWSSIDDTFTIEARISELRTLHDREPQQ